MKGATIVAGRSHAAKALVAALAKRGEAPIWLGGDGERAGDIASLGEPDDEACWAKAVVQAERSGLTRVLNLLVNPAPTASLDSLSHAQFDAAYLGTVVQSFAAMRATIPTMRERGGGRFLNIWEQRDAAEADGLVEPVLLGGLELCSRVIAKEYAGTPTVNVNLVQCRSGEASLDALLFWADYLGGETGCYVTGANVGRAAH